MGKFVLTFRASLRISGRYARPARSVNRSNPYPLHGLNRPRIKSLDEEHGFTPSSSTTVMYGLKNKRKKTAGPSAPPDFLWNLVALANFMRLSLRKAADLVVASAAR